MAHDNSHVSSATPEARIAWGLAAAGIIPFLGGLVDMLFATGAWVGPVQVYAAVIASFLCGIHWGTALLVPRQRPIALLVASNVTALLAWGAAMAGPAIGFFMFAILFAALTFIDQRLHRAGTWPAWYWRLRLTISAIVAAICLLIGLLA